jgi:hypothetical protein
LSGRHFAPGEFKVCDDGKRSENSQFSSAATHTGVHGGYAAENRGADFVKHLVPSRSARQNKALDPTALLGASGCKHPEAPAMLAGQRRDWARKSPII